MLLFYFFFCKQVSETMAASSHQQQNGQIIGLGGIGALENDADTKLFVVKKTGDSQGITALISRQLQGMCTCACAFISVCDFSVL